MVKKLSASLRAEWTDYKARAWQRHLHRQTLHRLEMWRNLYLYELMDIVD